MTSAETTTAVTSRFPQAKVSEFRGQTRVIIDSAAIFDLLSFLKGERGFDFLSDITCVDYLNYREATDRFGLVVDGNNVDVPALFGTDVIKDLHPAGLAPGVVRFPDTVPGGTTFDFLAQNWGGASFDEWNLEKLEVVPEPASIFAFSFLGLAAVAWRHRSTRREPIAGS